MINGKRYGWEDITINLPHGPLLDVESIEYSDKQDKEGIYGRGSLPRGYGVGNYEGEGKLTLKREEFNRLVDYAKAQKRSLYRLPPFNISVSYANDDQPITTDHIKGVTFTETSSSSSQGDTSVNVELSFIILNGIEWNGLGPN